MNFHPAKKGFFATFGTQTARHLKSRKNNSWFPYSLYENHSLYNYGTEYIWEKSAFFIICSYQPALSWKTMRLYPFWRNFLHFYLVYIYTFHSTFIYVFFWPNIMYYSFPKTNKLKDWDPVSLGPVIFMTNTMYSYIFLFILFLSCSTCFQWNLENYM